MSSATETVYPNGSTPQTVTYTYDGDGNLLTVTDGARQHRHVLVYGPRPIAHRDRPSPGGTTTYAYDLAGRLVSLTDPDDNITTWTYNQANEVATQTSPTGGVTSYTYDLVGNVTSVTDPDGHAVSYIYNADNEETNEIWVNPSAAARSTDHIYV